MEHISASKIIQYSDCSLKYKFIYVDGLRKPAKSVHLAYGSAIHKGLEDLNKSLVTGIADIEDIYQSYHDSWYEELDAQGLAPSGYVTDKLYQMGLNAIEDYYNNFVDYEVIASELFFEVPYREGYTMKGIIDALIKRKGEIMVVDYKTSKEAFNRFKLDTSVQLAMYAWAFRKLIAEGKFPSMKKQMEDFISYYVIIKDYDTLASNIKMQRKKITDKHLDRMHYILGKFIEAKENEIYVPNYNSNCHWCEFKKECAAFTG